MARLLSVGALLAAFVLALHPAAAADKGKGKRKFDIDAIFKKLDTNNDGKLSMEEFAKSKLMQRVKEKRGEEAVTKIFKKMDTNNDGSISLEEFKKGMEELRKRIAERRKDKKKEKE